MKYFNDGMTKIKGRKQIVGFQKNTLTILIHREVSDDDWGGVGWRDHGHVRGHGVATGHWHRVTRRHAGAAGHLLGLRLLLSGGRRGRGGR